MPEKYEFVNPTLDTKYRAAFSIAGNCAPCFTKDSCLRSKARDVKTEVDKSAVVEPSMRTHGDNLGDTDFSFDHHLLSTVRAQSQSLSSLRMLDAVSSLDWVSKS